MNTIQTNNSLNRRNIAEVCFDSCRRLGDRLLKIKNAVLAEFQGSFGIHEQMLRSALNEAEALAWQTEYPHLVFPVLAREKAQAAASWQVRQRVIRSSRVSGTRLAQTLPAEAGVPRARGTPDLSGSIAPAFAA